MLKKSKPVNTLARLLVAGAAAAMLQMTPGISHAADNDVVIGVFVPTTGPVAPLGTDMKNGYALAVQDAPTVKGRPVKLVVGDTQAHASEGLKQAQQLVLQDRAKVLIGGAFSSVVLGINAQAARLNVPIVTTNSQAVQTTGAQCTRYLFRTNPNDAMEAKANALLMKERPELLKKKWFVVYHDLVWGRSNKNQFEKIPGVNVVGEAGRPFGTADWSSTISQIKASGANAIYLALAVGDDMPAFISQARNFGLDQLMLPPLGMPDSMLKALGKKAVGLTAGGLFGSWMMQDDNPKMAKFVKEYYHRFGMVPGPQAIQAYAGMRLTLAAMDNAKSLSTDDIIASMDKQSVDTIIGHLAIRKGDHQGTVGTYIAKVVKLPKPEYGASVGWKVTKKLPWDEVKIPLSQTGCKGL